MQVKDLNEEQRCEWMAARVSLEAQIPRSINFVG